MKEVAHNLLETPERPGFVLDLHDGTNAQVSIIVIHYENPGYLNICLQSIYAMSNLNNYEVIVVDNGSGQDTQDYLTVVEEEGVKVVRNKENLYWSKAANQGVAVADPSSQYYIFMHCDTVVLNPGWIDLLVNVSEAKKSGLVGTQLHSYYLQNQKVDYIQEWCILISKECWEDVGPWPEELPLVGHSFVMTLKAQQKGYKPQAMTNPLVHHYKAISYKPNELERISEKAMSTIPKIIAEIRDF